MHLFSPTNEESSTQIEVDMGVRGHACKSLRDESFCSEQSREMFVSCIGCFILSSGTSIKGIKSTY